jgi:hypothetical protein
MYRPDYEKSDDNCLLFSSAIGGEIFEAIYGLVKYLPYFGWEPIVLTARLPNNNFNNVRIIETYYPGNATDLLKSKVGLKEEAAFRE